MNTLVLTLALIFLPGIIWARLDARYARQSKPSQTELLINVFVFGLVAYLATYLVYLIPCVSAVGSFNLTVIAIEDGAAATLQRSVVDDILVATAMSLLLAPGWLMIQRRKWVVRFLKWIGATNRYGDEDVWDYILSSDDPRSLFVNVRDEQTGQTFAGFVEVFSEAPGLRELVLSEVKGFDTLTGEETVAVSRMYLARDPVGMTLEFPATDANIMTRKKSRKESLPDGT